MHTRLIHPITLHNTTQVVTDLLIQGFQLVVVGLGLTSPTQGIISDEIIQCRSQEPIDKVSKATKQSPLMKNH